MVVSLVPVPAEAAGGQPATGIGTALNGVACPSPSDCWAVGDTDPLAGSASTGGPHNEVLHWNGRAWRTVSVPSPAVKSTGSDSLQGIACVSPRDCWAVGSYERDSTYPTMNQTLHWNGRRWALVKTPSPKVAHPGSNPEGSHAVLTAVACASARNCWAVGSYERDETDGLYYSTGQTLHWNGGSWSIVGSPVLSGHGTTNHVHLSSVSCTGKVCFAAGDVESDGAMTSTTRPLILRRDGHAWTEADLPAPASSLEHLASISCRPHVCMAVGTYTVGDQGGFDNEVLQLSGGVWSRLLVPNPDGTGAYTVNGMTEDATNQLLGVSCVSATSCWAVGGGMSAAGAASTSFHWDGASWTYVPVTGTSALDGVYCIHGHDCWSVGSQDGTTNVEYHWNGKGWIAG